MKRILSPLLSATSLLTVLALHADAAAITANQVSLNPRLIGAGKLQRRFNNGLPASIFSTAAPVSASTVSLDEFLANAIASGALTKSGAGTLALSGSQNIFIGTAGGTLTLNGGNLNLDSGSVSIAGAGNLTIGGSVVVLTGDALLSSGTLSGTVVTEPNQTLTSLNLGNNNGIIQVLNGGNIVAPAAGGGEVAREAPSAPVPEPGTAMLFVLGMLAASQVRRRA